ncbi:MAG TPA: hypothetical protein VE693_11290 [Gaiellaceae bacterium]|jgi:hypothetical protein|nr:hypothetical protein [Gaiellaceae bacterium]
MASCKQCGGEVESVFRYCPWCGHAQRVKLTEFFFGHSAIEARARRALRVSRYLGDDAEERHVRFSVWSEPSPGQTRVEAAVSLDEDEADRVVRFLAAAPLGAREADTEVL